MSSTLQGEDFWREFEPYVSCKFCNEGACAECDSCERYTCPNHTVRVGENESYCPNCNSGVRR